MRPIGGRLRSRRSETRSFTSSATGGLGCASLAYLGLNPPHVPNDHRAADSPAGSRSLFCPATAVMVLGTSSPDPVAPPPLTAGAVVVSVTVTVTALGADGGGGETGPSSLGVLEGVSAGGEPSVSSLVGEGAGDSGSSLVDGGGGSSLVDGLGDGRVETFDDLKPPMRTTASRVTPTTIRTAPAHTRRDRLFARTRLASRSVTPSGCDTITERAMRPRPSGLG
jgi:hypothetical protein